MSQPADLLTGPADESAESLAWAEFRRHVSIGRQYLAGLEAEFCGELARCLDPYVHERRVRSYGAIVCRELPELTHLGRLVETADMHPDVIRSCADGRKAVALVVKGEPVRLLAFHEEADTEQDYASLAAWIEGVIVCNGGDGVVRIVTDASVTIVEGRRWTTKDLVFEAAEGVAGTVPAADPTTIRRLLELCHHRISPGKMGATLVYLLTDEADGALHRDAGVDVRCLGLTAGKPDDEHLILHHVRHRDGAEVFDRDGRLLRVNVILESSEASTHRVAPYGGTRHTSAARHTYDRPDVLAFVVSADGRVTVFSDGQRISELRMRDSHENRPADGAPVRRFEADCLSCGVSLSVRSVETPEATAPRPAKCPGCGETALEVAAQQVDAFMRKTTRTIHALLQLRASPGV